MTLPVILGASYILSAIKKYQIKYKLNTMLNMFYIQSTFKKLLQLHKYYTKQRTSKKTSKAEPKFLQGHQLLHLKSKLNWEWGGGAWKRFSPLTSAKVEISSQNILTFSFNHYAILLLNFKEIPTTNPELKKLEPKPPVKNQDHTSYINPRVTKLWSTHS